MRIFVIDDDKLMCEVTARALSKNAFEVVRFHSAVDAVNAIDIERPDLIVTDYRMPKMTGLELLGELQTLGVSIPVVIVTADLTDEVRARAHSMGVRHIFTKPLGSFDDLISAVRLELGTRGAPASTRELDELRLGMLTNLSHQLRTPVTAMKLAMEGLFTQISKVPDTSAHRMADISRRNIERIVTLVENQLKMLEMTIGDVTVARRIVDLNVLIRGLAGRLFQDDPEAFSGFEAVMHSGVEPRYLFTDPEALETVLTCLLCGGPPRARKEIQVEYDDASAEFQIILRLHYIDRTESRADTDAAVGSSECPRVVAPVARLDFETRAHTSMVEAMGGRALIEKNSDIKEVRIFLPVLPPFEREKDVLNPVRHLHKAAILEKQSVSFVKVEFETDDELSSVSRFRSFFERCRTVLGDRDYLLRGRHSGAFYLALLDRTRDDLERISVNLSHNNGESDQSCLVSRPQSPDEDPNDIADLTEEIELV